jgi:hypothetical protein
MKPQPTKPACGDCGEPHPRPFMVHGDLWVWSILGPDILRLACAERRLGRPFTRSNFKADVPANEWVFELF